MSASQLRLFVAMDIPEEIREAIGSAIQGLKGETEGARWVKPQNLHLTLKFIGGYDEERLGELIEVIQIVAKRNAGFTAALGECGAFPSSRKARVIWVGMASGGDNAVSIARKLDKLLEELGVKRESRPFRSHLTLSRLRHPKDFSSQLETLNNNLKALSEMPFNVDEITLYQSILSSPQGPTYKALSRISLERA
jgi:2'-5' RNA ligase